MTTNNRHVATANVARTEVDWHAVARSAVNSAVLAALLGGALHYLSRRIDDRAEEDVAELWRDDDQSEERHDAAALLGVPLHADEGEIRAALRERLSSSRAHPDHGGNEDDAKRLIAARDLLIAHARAGRE